MTDPIPYNPLDRDNLGRSVADALLDRPVFPLAKLNSFVGEGIYALYYVGDHPAYEEIAIRNRDDHFLLPIYVGKAVPKGARKGEVRTGRTKSRVLFNRLKEHRDSIKLVEAHPSSSLKLDDFYCRYLVVEDIWIPLGESLLIAKFSPYGTRCWTGSVTMTQERGDTRDNGHVGMCFIRAGHGQRSVKIAKRRRSRSRPKCMHI